MTAPTEKQMAFLATLTDRLIEDYRPHLSSAQNSRARGAWLAMLALSLPTPTDTHEASAQINLLKSPMDLMQYAKTHESWMSGVADRFEAAFGKNGASVPGTTADGFELRGAQFRTIVEAALAGQPIPEIRVLPVR
jgi:hypothetical protein